ncbi:hypothetical protein BD310DRAFT_904748 [Dichomitus squalens]|uniref:Uncharacterized protein n=1 Tax=Dichomitus squalens TaxID=114155 RepID=A0A4Q9Q3B6_9APHY|nr:hypothetical protein BD310DRAFT_904748 [Dichomitus squalens]
MAIDVGRGPLAHHAAYTNVLAAVRVVMDIAGPLSSQQLIVLPGQGLGFNRAHGRSKGRSSALLLSIFTGSVSVAATITSMLERYYCHPSRRASPVAHRPMTRNAERNILGIMPPALITCEGKGQSSPGNETNQDIHSQIFRLRTVPGMFSTGLFSALRSCMTSAWMYGDALMRLGKLEDASVAREALSYKHRMTQRATPGQNVARRAILRERIQRALGVYERASQRVPPLERSKKVIWTADMTEDASEQERTCADGLGSMQKVRGHTSRTKTYDKGKTKGGMAAWRSKWHKTEHESDIVASRVHTVASMMLLSAGQTDSVSTTVHSYHNKHLRGSKPKLRPKTLTIILPPDSRPEGPVLASSLPKPGTLRRICGADWKAEQLQAYCAVVKTSSVRRSGHQESTLTCQLAAAGARVQTSTRTRWLDKSLHATREMKGGE